MMAFMIGLFIGAFLGVIIMSLCIISKYAEEAEREYYEDLDRK